MAFYQLNRVQKLPTTPEILWDFISSPMNLKEITPSRMGFIVTSNTGSQKMYSGMIISYKVSPILGLRLNWVTEITHIKNLEYFVDEQRIGPYSMWHHEHKLEPIKGGVLMTDIVTYQPPFGIFGAIANSLFIKRQLKEIFDYRAIALEKKFGRLDK